MIICLTILVLWYVCGVLNIVITQAALGGDVNFTDYNRTVILWFTYGLGPLMLMAILLYAVTRLPIKYGTRFGRHLGRLVEDYFN
jgi:hypothetical protein